MGRKKCASQIYMPTHFVLVRASERERKRKRKRKRERERERLWDQDMPSICTAVYIGASLFRCF